MDLGKRYKLTKIRNELIDETCKAGALCVYDIINNRTNKNYDCYYIDDCIKCVKEQFDKHGVKKVIKHMINRNSRIQTESYLMLLGYCDVCKLKDCKMCKHQDKDKIVAELKNLIE